MFEDISDGDRVTVVYESAQSNSEIERTGVVTTYDRYDSGSFRRMTVDTGDELDDGTPKVLAVTALFYAKALWTRNNRSLGDVVRVDQVNDDN